jgi:hypothetical protein
MTLAACVRISIKAKAVLRECAGCHRPAPMGTGQNRCTGCPKASRSRT